MEISSGAQSNIQRLAAAIGDGLISALLLAWALLVLRAPWGSLAPHAAVDACAAAAAFLLCAAAAAVKRPWLKWGLRLVPWAALLPWLGEIRRGLLLWLNCVLTLWNQVHQDGLAL